MVAVTYRVEEVTEDKKGEIKYATTLKLKTCSTLEEARKIVSAYRRTITTNGDKTYCTIWKITTTETITEEPVE